MKLVRCIIDDCGVWVVDTCMSWHAWNAHRRAIQPGYRYRYFMESGEATTVPRFEIPGTAPIPPKRTLVHKKRTPVPEGRCHWGGCRRRTKFWRCNEHRVRHREYQRRWYQHRRAGA